MGDNQQNLTDKKVDTNTSGSEQNPAVPSNTSQNANNKPDENADKTLDVSDVKGSLGETLKNVANEPAIGVTTDNSDVITRIVENIIKEQESIIGPVALEQATKVEGLKVDLVTNKITFTGDKKEVLERLIRQYEQLFGRISIEICKEAVRNLISQAPKDQVPQILL